MIVSVTLNPALDRTLTVDNLCVGGVNRVISSRVDAGGKGINVSKMAKVLGSDTLATGILGGSSGIFIQKQLDALEIPHDFVVSENTTRTNLKITDQLRRTSTELNEPGEPVSADLLEQVWEKITGTVSSGDTVVISGTNPPGMKTDTLACWISRLREKGVVTALDTTGEPMRLGIEAQPSLIKSNLSEFSELVGEPLHYIRDVIAAARQITWQGVERVVVSMGGDGALFVTKDQVLRGHGIHVPVGSTVGSGDAMFAALLHFMQKGCDWEETARWSLATGSAKATCEGLQMPAMSQIEELLERVVVEPLF